MKQGFGVSKWLRAVGVHVLLLLLLCAELEHLADCVCWLPAREGNIQKLLANRRTWV